jgi:cytochrome b pre-mRNA-processing protein 3
MRAQRGQGQNVRLFSSLRRRRRALARARGLFGEISRTARSPAFYDGLGVADTLDGRFDVLVLVAHLVLRRLRDTGAEGRALGQAVFDTMFADMDEALRELGVGDLSVGRKIREMTEAYYGRALAYEEALQSAGTDDLLEAALARNIYRGRAPSAAAVSALAAYVRALSRSLSQLSDEALLAGDIPWPPMTGRLSHGKE